MSSLGGVETPFILTSRQGVRSGRDQFLMRSQEATIEATNASPDQGGNEAV